jgi:HSP20 family protein
MSGEKSDQKKKDEEKDAININVGKFSLGGIFQGLENIIDLVSKMEETGEGEVNREEAFTSPSGRVNAVYGISVKTGLGGKSTIEPFGNVKKTSKGPVVEEERQPLVDIFDEKDHILVIAELPGIEEGHISTTVKGDILTLSAANGDRKYYKEVVLPKDIDADTLRRKYKNGVLEIRMNKR